MLEIRIKYTSVTDGHSPTSSTKMMHCVMWLKNCDSWFHFDNWHGPIKARKSCYNLSSYVILDDLLDIGNFSGPVHLKLHHH